MGSESRRSSPLPIPFWFGVVVMMLAGGFLGWRWLQRRPEPPPVEPGGPKGAPFVVLDAEQAKVVGFLKRKAIALLENAKPSEAEPLWQELAKTLPREPLVLRNRAISAVQALKDDKAGEWYDRAGKAIQTLGESDPKSSLSHWLEARLLLKDKDRETAIEQHDAKLAAAIRSFDQAAKAAPDDPVAYYELYQAAKDSRDEALRAQGREALATAYRLAPDNFFLMIDWLEVTAETKSDAGFAEVAGRLRKLLEPLRAGIERRTRADVDQMLGQALSAAEKGQWPIAYGIARRLGFVRSEDVAQSDWRRIQPHPLEFVLHDFQRVEMPAEELAQPPAIPVKLVPSEAPSLATLAGVRDLQLYDLDLDGTLDLAALLDGKLVTFRQNETGKWEAGFSADIEGMTDGRLLLADLDRDDKLPGQKAAAKPAEAKPAEPSGDEAVLKGPFFKADPDAIVYGASGIVVLRNERDAATGQRSWQVIPQEGAVRDWKELRAAVFADLDHDGDLDLVAGGSLGIRLAINRGNGMFDDVTRWSVLPEQLSVTQLVAVDLDRDVDIDIVATADDGRVLGWLENLRHLNFRWQAFESNVQPAEDGTAVSVAVFDNQRKGSWDLVTVGARGQRIVRTELPVPGKLTFSKRQTPVQAGIRGTRFLLWDYDNDGFQDLLTWGTDGVAAHRGSELDFAESPAELFAKPLTDVTVCDVGDIDQDGDLDLAVATAAGVQVLFNEGGNENNWLDAWVLGIDEEKSGRVNHYAVGSVVELRSAGRYQEQLVTRPRVHFGLGPDPRVDVLRVIFTNGIPQSVLNPQPNEVVREEQRLLGSCPYLYTWTGERFEFYTDLLWAAPLGLQVADGVIMKDRPWEYLKVDGERLQSRNGRYAVQITEELWEAGYFDQVELIAVDHPADVEVFSNEKVGSAELAARKIHTVRQRRLPIAARDSQGRDVLPELRERDGVFAQCFERTQMQGLAEPHFLELDLGPLKTPRSIKLFLTGWIYPTDTSLNIGLGQNPTRQGPKPPRVLAPNAAGQWQEVIPFMGFPGGKTKTIAVDLSGVFPAQDYRLRIETSQELRWDEVFFTVDDADAEVRETPLKLLSADLHYRGRSRTVPRTPGGPEMYDYAQVDLEPQWPPMRGKFTRFGDVRELLTEWDDRMVVLGAGDEMTVEFDAGPPVPPGWKRDFLLHNVGWDKDCVLNTVYGQTVEPMPFRAMPSYPYPSELYPDRPELQDYLRRYQTREQPLAPFWRQIRNNPPQP